jgi:hypothetical protein
MTDHRSKEVGDTTADVGIAALGAGIGLAAAGPGGVLLSAVAPPVMNACLEWIRSYWTTRRQENVASVIACASELTGMEPEELLRRVLETVDKKEIFIRTLKTAQDAVRTPQLLALAHSLSATATTDDAVFLHAEAAFVRAMDQLDSAHIMLLSRFVISANEGNLEDETTNVDMPVETLTTTQIETAIPEYRGQIAELLAGLQGRGLIMIENSGGIAFGNYASIGSHWRITDIGRDFLERMRVVDELTQPPISG